MGFDLIANGPSSHIIAASPLSVDIGYLFLVGSNILPMVVQKLVAISVLSPGEMSA